MLRTLLKFTALGLALISSYFLIKGSSGLTTRDIVELSQDRWDFNLPVANNLIEQRQNAKLGLSLILASFILQAIDLMWPLRIKDFGVNPLGAATAVVICIAIALVCHYGNKHFIEKTKTEVTSILKRDTEVRESQ